ncbi:MAG: sigma-E factor negative regulatory protein [Burkholderiales bacterium]|nr:sigma-E factor negative regulatory protein [Burkholderiales bacterium]
MIAGEQAGCAVLSVVLRGKDMDEQKSVDSGGAQERRQSLSAVADGEARSDEVSLACAAWRDDAQARADWHAYALIGDVLRSDDLARSADADSAFLACLRERMAREPVVLAPSEPRPVQPAVAGSMASPLGGLARKRHWGTSMSVAAGALTVIGVAAVMRGVAVPEAPSAVALVPTQSAAPLAVRPVNQVEALMASGASVPASDPVANAYVRDAEIDRYLNAHRQYARGAVLATPGGMRQVAASPVGR